MTAGDATSRGPAALARKATLAERGIAALLSVLAAVLVIGILAHALQVTPSFDGAMNLQGAWSLAEGDGYRRTYGTREAFPHSIQTNLPYTVPAAVVIGTFGMGTWQAQATNLAYLLLLFGIAAFMLHRRFGAIPAALSVILLCVTPGLIANGLGGYGEVPGLCLALAALALFPWQRGRAEGWRVFAAGMCLALAVATKTVLAICSGAFGLVFLLFILFDAAAGTRKQRAMRLGVLLAGCLLPLVAVELWKLVALGGLDAYRGWWREGLGEIAMQAGTQAGFQDTPQPMQKLARHLQLLTQFMGVPQSLLLAWLLLPFALSAPFLLKPKTWRLHGPLAGLLLAAAIYFVWWLLVTPTLKAYHRRIFDGTLLVNLAWAWLAGAYLARTIAMPAWSRWLGYALCVGCLALSIPFHRKDLARIVFKPVQSDPAFAEAQRVLRGLPADADLYGLGWYSAPVLSLLSERALRDFNDTPVVSLDRSKPIYLVLDTPALAVGAHRQALATYESRPLLPEGSNNQIYEMRLDRLKSDVPPAAQSSLASLADLTTDAYPFVAGFYRPESNGTRWMSSDAFVTLRYNGSTTLRARTFALDFDRYVRKDGIGLVFLLNGCEVGRPRLERPGVTEIILPIPEHCRPETNSQATVRILSDNLVRSGTIQDDRVLSVVVNSVGFDPPAP